MAEVTIFYGNYIYIYFWPVYAVRNQEEFRSLVYHPSGAYDHILYLKIFSIIVMRIIHEILIYKSTIVEVVSSIFLGRIQEDYWNLHISVCYHCFSGHFIGMWYLCCFFSCPMRKELWLSSVMAVGTTTSLVGSKITITKMPFNCTYMLICK